MPLRPTVYHFAMFYLVTEVEARFLVQPADMDRAVSRQAVLQLVRKRVEGLCHPEYGVIIQLYRKSLSGEDSIHIKRCAVRPEGIHVTVLFGCFTYNIKRNDIVQLIVSDTSEDFIKGSVGSVEVLIPRSRIPDGHSSIRDGELVLEAQEARRTLKKGDILLARCFEVRMELGRMKIVATIDAQMLEIALRGADNQEEGAV